ncbi:pectinesterase inhibitor 3 [Benincasa hispida]|uniref:pectinesterase inhibitor 3 n=1 Tax=Benincasa hispida TaxID=102211 RepID=UPI0018FF39E8|nr:pectinesterase inhibitor 3 [Benincasa hispida]
MFSITHSPTNSPLLYYPSHSPTFLFNFSQYSTMTFLSLLLLLSLSLSAAHDGAAVSQDLIHSSCLQARYPNLCIRTLSSYAGAVTTPQELAQAAISVSLSLARDLSRYLSDALRQASMRQRAAVNDCVDQIGDSVEELSNTLGVLRHLTCGGDRRDFRLQMGNAKTWVSAALTNEDTCLDGFKEVDGEVKLDVKKRISKVAKVTSNALFMINRLDGGNPAGRKKLAAP